MYGTSINITDCIFTGRIQSTCKKSHSGFIGYHYSGTSALTNCLVILDEGSDTNQYNDNWLITFFTFDRFAKEDQSAGTYTNCYYYRDFGVVQGTKATAAQLSDGTIAYKLQNHRGDLVWGQRIGTDTEPVLTNDENYRVYRSKNGGYTNDPEEAYEGIQQDGEGNYLLGCLSDWQDFAEIVNGGATTANAKMTADINLGDDQTMIGSYAKRYSGIFDGQGHMLTFNYNTSSMSIESGQSYLGAAPFRDIEGATIRNLHTAGRITADKIGASGLVGWAYETNTIEQCWSDVDIVSSNNTADTFAGFVAFQYGTQLSITDCVYTGKIQSESKISHAGFIGYHTYGTATLTNCLLILDDGSDVNTTDNVALIFYTFDRLGYGYSPVANFSNCFYKEAFGISQGTQASSTDLSDGTTATALQNGRAEEVWVQDPLTNQPMLALFAGKYTVPASGLGTFSAKAKFSVPDGLKAYYCKDYADGKISVVAIDGVVPAETGVLLKGEPGETYTITASSETPSAIDDNALVAVTTQTTIQQTVDINEVNYTNFGLSGGVFKKVNSKGGTVKANRAYLHIPTSALTPEASAHGISLVWIDDEEEQPTSINDVRSLKEEVRGYYYNLNGQRVSHPTKGLYIVNGKKVIVK